MIDIIYSLDDFYRDAAKLAQQIMQAGGTYKNIYGVPRGGIPLAIDLSHLLQIPMTEIAWVGETLVVDDVVDSGQTRKRYSQHDFACLHIKSTTPIDSLPTYHANQVDGWIQYFWEVSDADSTIEDNIVRILEFIGEDPDRPGLKDTPQRIAKMYNEFFCAYDPARIPKVTIFKNGIDGIIYNEMLRDDGYFVSFCEHHMIPFFGEYYYGYIPGDWIMGASKIARIVDYYSGRLQVAERLVNNVIDYFEKVVNPLGQVLVMKARHLCKEMRGVKKWNSPYEVIAVRGHFAENRNGCKDEFMSRIQNGR